VSIYLWLTIIIGYFLFAFLLGTTIGRILKEANKYYPEIK